MVRRTLLTSGVILACLVALAIPLSRVGVSFSHDGSVERRAVSLVDGRLWYNTSFLPPAKPLDHDHYRVELGQAAQRQVMATQTRTGVRAATPPTPGTPISASVRLLWILLGSAGVWVLLVTLPALRLWWRRKRAVCLACGYQRAADEGPCSECGATPQQADERMRPCPGRLLRDAGIGVFLILLVLSCGAWMTVEAEERAAATSRSRAFDYSWYIGTCQPHLDGRVAYAEPGNGPNSLDGVMTRMGPGATIVLLPGKHTLHQPQAFRGSGGISDVWLVGSGADSTTLAMQIEAATRLRIDNVAIDCQDQPAIDLREGGSVMLRGCLFSNYNSGAGGSEAIFAIDSAFLIESCEFEGRTGRAASSKRGSAMDLRGECFAFVRGTRFIDNEEIVRDVNGVLDKCVVSKSGKGQGDTRFWAAQRGNVFERGTDYQLSLTSPPPSSKPFAEALDDPGPLQRLAAGEGLKAWSDPVALGMARKIRIDKDPDLWAHLLLSSSPEVRAIAAERLKLGTVSPPIPLEQALMKLDEAGIHPDVARSILAADAAARAGLEKVAAEGSDRAKANAAALLQLLDAQPGLPEVLRAQEQHK